MRRIGSVPLDGFHSSRVVRCPTRKRAVRLEQGSAAALCYPHWRRRARETQTVEPADAVEETTISERGETRCERCRR